MYVNTKVFKLTSEIEALKYTNRLKNLEKVYEQVKTRVPSGRSKTPMMASLYNS